MHFIEKFVLAVDAANDRIGRVVSWICLLMVLTTALVVILRYLFAIGFVWLQESYVWMHGIVFMVGAGFTLLRNGHVRVDVFYRPNSQRYRALVDLFGSFFLLLPVIAVLGWVSIPYVSDSWSRLEVSREAGGMPGLFLLKSVLLVFCVVVGLQGLSLAGRSYLILRGHPRFIQIEVEPHAEHRDA